MGRSGADLIKDGTDRPDLTKERLLKRHSQEEKFREGLTW